MHINSRVYRAGERDIIKLLLGDKVQPFYRSSGKNSGKPGEWLPFDNLIYVKDDSDNERLLWINKHKYIQDIPYQLKRYGTEELREISKLLRDCNIPSGIEEKPSVINRWLEH